MKVLDELMRNVFASADCSLNRLTAGRMRAKYGGCRYASLEETTAIGGEEDAVVSGVGMTLMQTPTLMMLMIFPPELRLDSARILLGEGKLDNGALVDSVLQEIANIFGSALANGLSKYLEEPVNTSPPEVAVDLSGALLASVVSGVPDLGDEVLLLDMCLKVGGADAECGIHLFFDENLRGKIAALPSAAGSR